MDRSIDTKICKVTGVCKYLSTGRYEACMWVFVNGHRLHSFSKTKVDGCIQNFTIKTVKLAVENVSVTT